MVWVWFGCGSAHRDNVVVGRCIGSRTIACMGCRGQPDSVGGEVPTSPNTGLSIVLLHGMKRTNWTFLEGPAARLGRTVAWLSLAMLAVVCSAGTVQGQTIRTNVPQVERGPVTLSTAMFRPTDAVRLRWNRLVASPRLKIGTRAGVYSDYDIPLTGGTEAIFRPSAHGLATGTYHGIITTARASDLPGIQAESAADPSVEWSEDFTFVVEAVDIPALNQPRDPVVSTTPTFEWQPVPGVRAYALFVSSTPFTVRVDPVTGALVLENYTQVWQHLTTATRVVYGAGGAANPLTEFPPLPLVPGQSYSYTVLNAYSTTDSGLISSAFGSAVTFTPIVSTTLAAPRIIAPRGNTQFLDPGNISFQWSSVPGAVFYDLALFERTRSGSILTDELVHVVRTTTTRLALPASNLLRSGSHSWLVVATTPAGARSVSATETFRHVVPMGRYRYTTSESDSDTQLVGVTVQPVSIDGGYTPPAPVVNATQVSVSDSLRTGWYAFEASKSGYADSSFVARIRTNQLTSFSIRLRRLSARISGFVVDEKGLPLADARVVLRHRITDAETTVYSQQNGTFEVSLAPGTYEITVFADGFRPSLPVVVSAGRDARIVLSQPISLVEDRIPVSGRVVDASGSPVPLATVVAVTGSQQATATTDSDGRYTLRLSEGDWTLEARANGLLSSGFKHLTLLRGDAVVSADFRLGTAAASVSGRVVQERLEDDGTLAVRGLDGVVVLAIPAGGPATQVTTDSRGDFSIPVAEGGYRILAEHAGALPARPLDVFVRAGDDIKNQVIVVGPAAARIRGTVEDGSGAGLDGVVVLSETGARASTANGGRYTLRTSGGLQRLSVDAPGYYASGSTVVAADPSRDVTDRRIRMVANALRIAGHVSSTRGVVAMSDVMAVSGVDTVRSRSLTDGTFRMSLPPGTWTVTARSALFGTSPPVSVTGEGGQSVDDVALTLPGSARRLEGHVGWAGEPLVQTRLSVGTSLGTLFTTSREGGYFSLLVPANAALSITAAKNGYAPETLTLPANDTSSPLLTLQPAPAVLSGRAVDRAGVGLAAARILLTEPARPNQEVTTDAFGRFTIGLPAGNWTLSVSATGFLPSSRTVRLEAGQVRAVTDLVLASSTGSLQVTVSTSDAAAEPVDRARVFVSGSAAAERFTGSNGLALLSGLPGGSYTLTVTSDSLASTPRLVTIVPGETTEVSVAMGRKTGGISGRISDSDAAGILGASVVLRQPSGSIAASVLTTEGGAFTIEDVTPGTYRVEITRSGFISQAFDNMVVLDPATTPSLDVVLVALEGTLRGRVLNDQSNAPVADALVRARTDAGDIETRTGPDGMFDMTGMAVGSARILVEADGYNAGSLQVNSVPASSQAFVSLRLVPLRAEIIGQVLDDSGAPLPFGVPVVAESGTVVRTVETNAQGFYIIQRVPENATVRIRTAMQRKGYREATVDVSVPGGVVVNYAPGLTIVQGRSAVTGFVLAADVTLSLYNTATGALVARTLSLADGSYRLDNLPAGEWTVRPSRPGYAFIPSQRSVTVGDGETVSASFTTNTDLADVLVNVNTASGAPKVGVPVLFSSLDRSILRTDVTNSAGFVAPSELPAGNVYRVEPRLEGSRFEPRSVTVDVSTNRQASALFTEVPATAFINVRFTDDAGNPLQGVETLLLDDVGDSVLSEIVASDAATLGPVPPGNHELTARLTGYLDAAKSLVLAPESTTDAGTLILFRRAVDVRGRIVRAGRPVQGLAVELVGDQTFRTSSAADGSFTFPAVPLGAGSVSVHDLRVLRPGQPAVEQPVIVSESMIRSGLDVPDILLPSARVSVQTTRSGHALDGIRLEVRHALMDPIPLVTDDAGLAATAAILDPGTYEVIVASDSLLVPYRAPRAVLVSVGDSVHVPIELPYIHKRLADPLVRDESVVVGVVGTRRLFQNARVLFPGAARAPEMLAAQAGGWSGAVVPTVEGSFRYEVQVAGLAGPLYTSGAVQRTVKVAGRLSTVRVEPDISGRTLRQGATYNLSLVVRDELGADLSPRFTPGAPGATISWSARESLVSVAPLNASGLTAALSTPAIGDDVLLVRVEVDGVARTLTIPVHVENVDVTGVSLRPDETRVYHDGGQVFLTVSGLSKNGDPILLGTDFDISLSPPDVGVMTGQVVRIDAPDFIGPVDVQVRDRASGASGTVQLSAFSRVGPGTSVVYNDRNGTSFHIRPGTFPVSGELSLSRQAVATAKRFPTPTASGPRLNVAPASVRLALRSDQALPGDSLGVAATLELFQGDGLRLLDGSVTMARFDDAVFSWSPVPSTSDGSTLTSDRISRVGEFAAAVESAGLAIKHAALLPTPFSPLSGAMKIGYVLESDAAPVSVSIHIVNVRGERVRTLLEHDPQWPGRYGSSSGLRAVEWDGRTDSGEWARNGRYLIYIEARDGTGSVREVLQAVLVK